MELFSVLATIANPVHFPPLTSHAGIFFILILIGFWIFRLTKDDDQTE